MTGPPREAVWAAVLTLVGVANAAFPVLGHPVLPVWVYSFVAGATLSLAAVAWAATVERLWFGSADGLGESL